MIPLFPIFCIWFVVLISILDLLIRLDLVHWISIATIENLILIFIFGTSIFFWKSLNIFKKNILEGIKDWDEDLAKDIRHFLNVRGRRLLTSMILLICLATLLFGLKYLPLESNGMDNFLDILFYVYLIALVHISLVGTLIFLKLIRTFSWIKHENHLSDIENT